MRSAITATDTIVSLLEKQNADLSQTLSLADEYLTALNGSKSAVKQLITSWNVLELWPPSTSAGSERHFAQS